MDQATSTSLGAVLGILGFIVAVVSAVASSRSAKSAKEAQQALIAQHLSNTRSDVARLVSACTLEHRRVQNLSAAVTKLHDSLAIWSGGYGDSRWKVALEEVQKAKSEAEAAYAPVCIYADSPTKIGQLIEQDAERYQVAFAIALANIQSVTMELNRLHDVLSQQASHHLAQTIADLAKTRERQYLPQPTTPTPGG